MVASPLHKELIQKIQQAHAFWSFQNVSNIADEDLIAGVLMNLDIEDIQKLFTLYSLACVKKVWQERLLSQEPLYHNVNRLYA